MTAQRPGKQVALQVSRTACMTYEVLPCRRAMTLVELLVVIFIVLTVTALAIPIVAPAMRGRQVREASRLVTAYLAGARSEALRTGRATGVIFDRFPGVPEMCISLSRCQVPRMFAGTTMNSKVFPFFTDFDSVANLTPLTNTFTLVRPITATFTAPQQSDFWSSRVALNDLIKFDYKGPVYRITGAQDLWDDGAGATGQDGEDDTFTVDAVDDAAPDLQIPVSGISYQVFRQPKRTSTPPVQLPPGIVIDLNFSGDDQGPFVSRNNLGTGNNKPNDQFVGPMPDLPFPLPDLSTLPLTERQRIERLRDSLQSVMIVFAPDGSVERVFRTLDTDTASTQNLVWGAERPTGPIHFLLGQRDRVPALLEVPDLDPLGLNGVTDVGEQAKLREEALARYNLFDLENLWITINPRSGLVSSTENSITLDLNDPQSDPVPIADHVRAARQLAREGQAMGGL